MLKKRPNETNDRAPVSTLGPISGGEKTIIGEHITIEGIIRGYGNLAIEGSVKGSIDLEKHELSVGTKGKVEAEIHAGNVTVSGQVNGNIKSTGRVSITKDADFSGKIKAQGISIEDGAFLKAVIELDKDGASRVSSQMKPPDQISSPPSAEPGNIPPDTGKEK
jgi:cytoskeletal protein CcmA (bactofilin family)